MDGQDGRTGHADVLKAGEKPVFGKKYRLAKGQMDALNRIVSDEMGRTDAKAGKCAWCGCWTYKRHDHTYDSPESLPRPRGDY
jgi:hypothetical protein